MDENITQFFDNICSCYNITDCDFLKNLILDTIDEDTKERAPLSEIQNYDTKFPNSAIFNSQHFQKLLKYYSKNTSDESVFKIPWDNFLFFGKQKRSLVDCNRISKEFACIVGFDSETFK